MKTGFRLVIHKNCKKEDRDILYNFLQARFELMKKGYGSGYHKSFYNRNIFGLHLNTIFKDTLSDDYTFKRLSTKRRIFGIVPVSELDREVNLKRCYCPTCLGGEKVKLKNGFNEQDYTTVYETGEIKG